MWMTHRSSVSDDLSRKSKHSSRSFLTLRATVLGVGFLNLHVHRCRRRRRRETRRTVRPRNSKIRETPGGVHCCLDVPCCKVYVLSAFTRCHDSTRVLTRTVKFLESCEYATRFGSGLPRVRLAGPLLRHAFPNLGYFRTHAQIRT